MPYGIKVTVEKVDMGQTSEVNPMKKGDMTWNSLEHLIGGKSVTVIPNVTNAGSLATRNLNLLKLIALLRAGVAMTNVTTEIDALSP